MTRQIAGNQHNPNRKPFDDYPTDPLWTQALCDRVRFRGKIWEPACGSGQMSKVLESNGYDVLATDLERHGADFLTHGGEWNGSIITNPPYRHADEFLQKALESATEQVAMLLPVNALGGKKRSAWLWHVQPPALTLLVPRYMNVLDRTSQFYHVWCVWDRQYTGRTEMDWATLPGDYRRLRHPTEIEAAYQKRNPLKTVGR